MDNLKNSAFVKLFFITILLIIVTIAFFYLFRFRGLQEKYLTTNIADKAAAIITLSEKSIARSLAGRDDVSLLNTIQSIMMIEDVTTAYVLDSEGKVLSHNLPEAWGKSFQDAVSLRAIKSGKALLQETSDGKSWLYSMPIAPSSTLFIGFSKQRYESAIQSTRKNFFLVAIIFVVIAVIVLGASFYYLGTQRSMRLDAAISTATAMAGSVEISLQGSDEFSRIASSVRELVARCSTPGQTQPGGLNSSESLVKELAAISGKDVLVAGGDRRIVCLTNEIKKLFQIDENSISAHLLDVIKEPALLALLTTSMRSPGAWQQGTIKGRTIRILTVQQDDATRAIAGTLIELQ